MARSMTAVLVCTLMVSSLLVTRAQDDSLAGLQQQSLGEYQQEEAQEIAFNMQMQKLEAEGKMADKASGAQIGGGRRLVQDLVPLQAQEDAEDIELNQEMQKLQAEGYGEDPSIGSRRRLVQDLRYVSKTSTRVLQYSCHILYRCTDTVQMYRCTDTVYVYTYVMSYGVVVSANLVSDHVCN